MRIKVIHFPPETADHITNVVNDALKELEDKGNVIIDVKHSATDELLSVLVIYKPITYTL